MASPQWSGIAERTPSIVADQIKNMDRKVAGFEVINNAGFETENLFGQLITEKKIQRRLEFLTDRTYRAAQDAKVRKWFFVMISSSPLISSCVLSTPYSGETC